jgi:UDP-N-acetylglucosamine acyltransferase
MTDVTVLSEIAPSARIAPDARIGPFCVVGPNVTIGPGTVLVRRVSVGGRTTIGSGNVIEEGCVLGGDPQDLKYAGGLTFLVIGHRNHFGRAVTAHIGTEFGGYVTRIGDDNVFMDGSHIAHDCYVDDHTHLGRNVMLAGHIRVQSGAVIEDFAGLHHFVTVGRYARVGAYTPVRRDVPPYTFFHGRDNDLSPAVRGIHEQGIAAAALSHQEEGELRMALKELFSDETALQTKIEQILSIGVEGQAAMLCEFCQQSLQGVFGRYRELFRGKTPPEAADHLPPERRGEPRRPVP